MTYNRDEFVVRLLAELDAPHTPENVKALHAWGECEGSEAAFNMLDTTWHVEGATEYNTFGDNQHVWNYPDMETGVHATVLTLKQDYYTHILAALKSGKGNIVGGPAREQMHTWGTNPDCIAKKIGVNVTTPADHTPTTNDPHPGETQTPGQQQDEAQGEPTREEPFSHDMRDWLHRVLRHLQTRQHRLPDDDGALLKHVVEQARRVGEIGQDKGKKK